MELNAMLRYDEGEKLTMYKDTEGYFTIGVGHLITKNPSRDYALKELDKAVGHPCYGYITAKESDQLLNTDVNSTLRQLSKTELHQVYIRIDTVRRSALINMCFQLGVSGVCQFKKFLGYMAVGDYQNAADEALDSRWARQTPNRAKRVTDVIRYGDFRSYN